jgi:DNA-binding GntR family transcriptional regulator
MEQLEITPTRVQVASIIRKAILSAEFARGEELSLTDMAARIGVSRTPVREAFQTLEAEGLIELRMNRGAVVKEVGEDLIRDHVGLRKLLEGEAVALAAARRMDTAPLEELQRAAGAGNAYVNYNYSFHEQIWAASKNRKLYALCETLWYGPAFSKSVEDPEYRTQSIFQHEQIIAAIRRGNGEMGRRFMAAHVGRNMDQVIAGWHEGRKIHLREE